MDLNAVNIRIASPEDIELLSSFASRAFLDAYSGKMNEADINAYISKSFHRGEIEVQLKSNQMLFHLAMEQNEIIGYTKLRWDRQRSELKDDKAVELERIYVSGEYYRSGLGSLLFQHALAFSRKKDFQVLWLAVWEKNERALSLYKKSGMEIFGVQEFTVGRIVNNDFVLRINL